MKVEDGFDVAVPLERAWMLITDPEVVGPCIPGCGGIEVIDNDRYRASIRVGLGPIKTTFHVEVTLTDQDAPRYAASVTRGEEGTRASTLTAHNALRLEEVAPDRTRISYSSDVSLVGRLGTFGLGVMKKKAAKLGEEFAEAFRQQAEARETV